MPVCMLILDAYVIRGIALAAMKSIVSSYTCNVSQDKSMFLSKFFSIRSATAGEWPVRSYDFSVLYLNCNHSLPILTVYFTIKPFRVEFCRLSSSAICNIHRTKSRVD